MQNEIPNHRAEMIQQLVSLALRTTFDGKGIDEQSLMNLLGGLVREKLLSAEDSYKLRDQLLQNRGLDSYIDSRIQYHLKNQIRA